MGSWYGLHGEPRSLHTIPLTLPLEQEVTVITRDLELVHSLHAQLDTSVPRRRVIPVRTPTNLSPVQIGYLFHEAEYRGDH